MNIINIIEKKRDKKLLNKNEIDFFIRGILDESIADYQTSSLLMAIFLNGLNDEETYYLTKAIIDNGEYVDFKGIDSAILDKHSTGGVGDKVSLILGPILASMGYKFLKMSGRSLGFTGGTLDKLESIPGFKVNQSDEWIKKTANDLGFFIISQSENIAKADKILYALRDVCASVDSIPLIASSILSKKFSFRNDSLVIDVKCGSGAFMENIEKARELCNAMLAISKAFQRKTTCIISSMNKPLGKRVGNNLEIIEVIDFLKGNYKDYDDLYDEINHIVYELILNIENVEYSFVKEKIKNVLDSGDAFEMFLKFVHNQGGDISYIENINKFDKAKFETEILADASGYLSSYKLKDIAKTLNELGAGRLKKEDKIDYTVGLINEKNIGDKIDKGDLLFTIRSNKELCPMQIKKLKESVVYADSSINDTHILEVIK